MQKTEIKGLSLDPTSRALRADSIEVSGPVLSLSRDAQGNFHALGLKTMPSSPAPAAMAPAVASPAPVSEPAPEPQPHHHHNAIDHFEIGHFAWKGVRIDLTDSAVAPVKTLAISDAGITADDLAIHLRPGDFAAKEGRFTRGSSRRVLLRACRWTESLRRRRIGRRVLLMSSAKGSTRTRWRRISSRSASNRS